MQQTIFLRGPVQVRSFFKLAIAPIAIAGLALAACGDDSGAQDAQSNDAQPNLGTFSLAWSISDGSSPLRCDEVGAFSIAVTLIPVDGLTGESESFACSAGQAKSRGLKPGVYSVRIDARASGSRSLLQEPVAIASFEIVANVDTALPAQSFVISPVGSFTFSINAGAAAGNCADVDAGGAGMVGVRFGLRNQLGACVEAEFMVADGSQPGGSYTSNCTTPPPALPCIGSDQLVSVDALASGQWSLISTGQIVGPIDCYERVSGFTVAGAGLPTELGELSLVRKYSAACDPNFVEADGGLPDAGVADASP